LVLVTRRGYDSYDESDSPGSSPLTDNEIEDMKACREIVLERFSLEVASFLLWFADTQNIPKISDDGKSGGFSVMGWSMGIVGPLSLLAHPNIVPKESQQKLASYFRQFILYGILFFAIILRRLVLNGSQILRMQSWGIILAMIMVFILPTSRTFPYGRPVTT
jgi:hypothetical protein